MISDTYVTKVTLEHILYPVGGPTYPQQKQNQNVNQPRSGTNYYQYTVQNTKDGPFYEVKPQTEVSANEPGHKGDSSEVLYNEEYPSKGRIWPLQKNTTGL
jgi:hypothetical protein